MLLLYIDLLVKHLINPSLLSTIQKTLNINSFEPHFVILLGDFDVKSKLWSVNDITTEEGRILEN